MKIVVFITQFYQQSGAEKLALNFARTAHRLGHDVCLLSMYRRDNPRLAAAAAAVTAQTGCRVDYLGLPEQPRPWDIVRSAWRLRRWLARNRPDLIEASMLGPSTLAALATLGSGVRCVIGIHAVFDRTMHGGLRFALFKAALCLNPAARVYCVSHAVDDAWSLFAPTLIHPRCVIGNAIDDIFFEPTVTAIDIRRQLGIADSTRLILVVGSLVRNKGIDIALDACAPLLQQGNCQMLFVGETGKVEQFHRGDENFYARFMARVNGEFKGRVHLLGHRDDVASLMRASDVLLHPARSEGFGLVLAEAMACGLPVVASHVGGIPEVLADGAYGELCAAGDALAFTAALRRVLTSDATSLRRQRLRLQQRADDFRPERRASRLIDFALLERPA